MSTLPSNNELPTANLRPRRGWSPLWLLPLAALAVAVWLLVSALAERGLPIDIQFRQGYGLKAGDALRYRGIDVGKVSEIQLNSDLAGIRVRVRLDPRAADLARAGSRFWIVRPRLDISGASGLDTVIGANYLSVLPGTGEPQQHFVGLDDAPLIEALEPGGLEIVLTTPGKGGLRTSAPLSYRQVIIGTIVDVDLASDAGAVQARVYIKPDYATLIRDNVKFWKTGGARFRAGLGGLSVDVDSVSSLILGGVNLAIPPEPGQPVASGHIFKLYEEPEPEWLEWTPSLSLDDAVDSSKLPTMAAVALHWSYKNMLYQTRDASRTGWALPVENGLLGPADLFSAPAAALADSAVLAIGGSPATPDVAEPYSADLALLPVKHGFEPWPAAHRRSPNDPEDTLIVAGSDVPPRSISAHRYQAEDGYWRLDDAQIFDPIWHGAAAVATSDGAVIGFLIVTDTVTYIATLPPT